jgi:alanyl-tRNA synthetase
LGKFLPKTTSSTATSTTTSGRWATPVLAVPAPRYISTCAPMRNEKAKVDGRTLVNKDNPLVIEIWNLVFMQYNRKADGSLEPLPRRSSIRAWASNASAWLCRARTSNYDTDVFQPIIQAIAEMSGTNTAKTVSEGHRHARRGRPPARHRLQHCRRTACPATPRRAMSSAASCAVPYATATPSSDQKEPFMYKLRAHFISRHGPDAYPELEAQKELIIQGDEGGGGQLPPHPRYGITLLNKVMADTKAAGEKEISTACRPSRLFDTYGFPLDLTELICRENGLTVDEEFNVEMGKQKAARTQCACGGDRRLGHRQRRRATQFVGYDYTECECSHPALPQMTQKKQYLLSGCARLHSVLCREMGGQVGDTRVLCSDFETIEVIDTKRENNLPIHIVKKLPATSRSRIHACVDVEKRHASARPTTPLRICSTEALRRCSALMWSRKAPMSTARTALRLLAFPESNC